MTSEACCPGTPVQRSTQTHVCFPGWPESSEYTIICTWTGSGLIPDWSCRHSILLSFRTFGTSMPEPLRRLRTQAKGIGLFRESNHWEYFIKSNSFCSRNAAALFTLPFRNVCDCSQSCGLWFSYLLWASIGELTQKVASPTSKPPFTWKQVNMSSHSSTRPPWVSAVEPELLHTLRDETSLRPRE